jgi:hypothetical protein
MTIRYKNEVDTLFKINTTLTAYQCCIQKESRHITSCKERKGKEMKRGGRMMLILSTLKK